MARIEKYVVDVNADKYRPNEFVSRLVFFGVILMAPVISPGMTAAFSSIALPQLELSLDEVSWFASIISVARPFGCLFTGFVIDKYGRRVSMVSVIVPNIIGWSLLVNKHASLTQLYIGRLFTGFALGGCTLPFTIYLAECVTVNDLRIRSSVSALPCVSMTTGFFLVYSLGAILSYNEVALISGCWSALSLLLILAFVPESPTWLYGKGRIGDAEAAQQRLGIKQPILVNRKGSLAALIGGADLVELSEPRQSSKNCTSTHYLSRIKSREVYKPLVITVTLLLFAEFSGLNVLVSYMVDVITVHPLKFDPYVLSVICGALQILACVLSSLILPCSGVRVLSVTSFVGASIGFLVLALSILFESSSVDANFFNYLHFVSVWVTMLVGTVGVQVIPYAILGEMFPDEVKGYACLPLFAAAIFNFTVLKVFPYMFARHKNVVFFLFSVVGACGAIFVGRYLPETVGKTMDEIRIGFKQRNEDYDEYDVYEKGYERSRINGNSILYEKLSDL